MEHDTVHSESSASSTHTVLPPPVNGINEKARKSFDVEKQDSKLANDVATAVAAAEGAETRHGEHPDGGLKAWSVVIGVSATSVCVGHLLTDCTVCYWCMCHLWSCEWLGCEFSLRSYARSAFQRPPPGFPSVLHREPTQRHLPFHDVGRLFLMTSTVETDR